MRLGVGKAVITPPLGLPMAGYAFRGSRGAEAVLDELEARVFWFQAESASGENGAVDSVLIITADLIGFDEQLTAEIRGELASRFGLQPEAVLLAASHTHSGPQTCRNMVDVGAVDWGYLSTLRAQVLAAAETARQNMQSVSIRYGCGHLSGYAINRRLIVNGKAVAAPNPEGVRDDDVPVISCWSADGRLIGVLFQYTCHPTVLGEYRYSADYPGAARRHVERELGATAAFLPGCFGDVRPHCVLVGGKSFRRGTAEDVAAFGAALGGEVVRVVQMAGPARGVHASSGLAAQAGTITLPLAQAGQTASLSWQRLDLADGLTLVALGGELSVEYGHFIKGLRPNHVAIPLGYANGMVGYIPTAQQFAEGGYEPDTSTPYFGLPAPFDPQIEDIIHSVLRDVFMR